MNNKAITVIALIFAFLAVIFYSFSAGGSNNSEGSDSSHIPPLAYHFFTPLFDLLVSWTCREYEFKSDLVQAAKINQRLSKAVEDSHASSGDTCRRITIVDLGCGTGTLATIFLEHFQSIALKLDTNGDNQQDKFNITYVCLDPDEPSLSLAKNKISQFNQHRYLTVQVEFVLGTAEAIPVEDNSVDVVTSTLVFHHLPKSTKINALREISRILKPLAEFSSPPPPPPSQFLLADFSTPDNWIMRLLFYFVQILDGFETTQHNVDGLLPILMKQAGLQVTELNLYNTIFGSIRLYESTNSV